MGIKGKTNIDLFITLKQILQLYGLSAECERWW